MERDVAHKNNLSLRVSRIAVVVVLLLSVALIAVFRLRHSQFTPAHEKRILRFNLEISNNSSENVADTELHVSLPTLLKDETGLPEIKLDAPFTLDPKASGQTLATLRISVPAYSHQIFHLEISPNSDRTFPVPKSGEYLQSTRKLQADHESIKNLATELKRNTNAETVDAIREWVKRSLVEDGYSNSDRGALWALENRRGDCTEYSALVTALLRASDIPARRIGGFIAPGNKVIFARDYHNWSEYFYQGSWHIVDALKPDSIRADEDYVPFNVLDLVDESGTARFYANDSRLIVRME